MMYFVLMLHPSLTLLILKYFHNILIFDVVYKVYFRKLLNNNNKPILLFAVNLFIYSSVVIMPNKSLLHITLV